tara:strand:- start:3066 stop:3497 length:432 start_codon:yes stop_codon:yes gene_type:complete
MTLENFLNGKNVETYFDEKLKECGNYEKLPDELVNCNCCERHKICFPTLGLELPKFNKCKDVIKIENKCECPCRHIARHICREWELINEVETLDTEDSTESEEDDSAGSLEDFIVPDKGFKRKERKALDKALDKFRGKKQLRR